MFEITRNIGMINLNLPASDLRFCNKEDKTYVFDPFRKKYVALTPEEWVRQNFLSWLVRSLGYPKGLIAVETPLIYNQMQKRADAVVYSRSGAPLMIIECKSTNTQISEDTFSQAARYNFSFKCRYMVLTNGLDHYCSMLDYENKKFHYLRTIPHYMDLEQ